MPGVGPTCRAGCLLKEQQTEHVSAVAAVLDCQAGGKAAKRTAGSAGTFGLSQLRLLPSLWLHGRVAAEHGAGSRHEAHVLYSSMMSARVWAHRMPCWHSRPTTTAVRQLVLVFVRVCVCMARLHL